MLFSRTIKNTISGIFLLVTAFSFAQSEELKTLPIGEIVPMLDYKMENLDGKMMQLGTSGGEKGLLVVFSCNTCPFVVGSDHFEGWEKQYNDLNRFAAAHGYNMVLVNSNEAKRNSDDSPEAMQKRAKEKGYSMPYLIDKNSQLADAFGARTTPHIFLLNNKMELVYTGAIDNKEDGKRSSDESYLKNAIEANASGKEIVVNTTPPRGCSIKRVKK
ncbi:thioredoxin family protein [Fluviicola chungangensis]|uniref:Thioredoxin family protein n=2 Tax=Fluviicola chungangensis TaxID=2597671 RepID=A0A556N3X5_9FLAO|nr:thioredoxin family protein [Fluviicola chungangensis]